MNKPTNLSVIIPCFNESHCLINNLSLITKTLDALNLSYEIILVNDGSTDTTLSLAQQFYHQHVSIISYTTNMGKGYAVKQGMLKANGDYRIFMDIDLSTSLESIQQFLSIINTKPHDIIIGNRKSSKQYQMLSQPFSRQVLGKAFTRLTNCWLGCHHHDFTCGFKMFSKQACAIIFPRLRINRWSFDAEILFIAHLHHLNVVEEPVIWKHQKNSKVRLLKDIMTSLIGLIMIRFNQIKGFYR